MEFKMKSNVKQNGTLGILAGRGDLVQGLLNHCKRSGIPYFIAAFDNQTDKNLVENHPHAFVNVAKVGALIDMLRTQGVDRIVMAGHFTRPDSWGSLKPDFKGALLIAKIIAKPSGDDGLLRILVNFLEGEGFKVLGVEEILGAELLAPKGLIGTVAMPESAKADIMHGLAVLKALSPLDVGQACVVQSGVVLGIEGPEGTDSLIERSGTLKSKGPGPVLIKMLKLGQETRVDRSVIGPETIKNVAKAGFSGIAIQGGGVILLNAQETIDLANSFGVFLVGIEFPT